jgi:hypothetical protein
MVGYQGLLKSAKGLLQRILSIPFSSNTSFYMAGDPASTELWRGKYIILRSDVFRAEFRSKVDLEHPPTTFVEYFKEAIEHLSNDKARDAINIWEELYGQKYFATSVVLQNNLACLKCEGSDLEGARKLLAQARKTFNANSTMFTDPNNNCREEVRNALEQNEISIGKPAETKQQSKTLLGQIIGKIK